MEPGIKRIKYSNKNRLTISEELIIRQHSAKNVVEIESKETNTPINNLATNTDR